MSPGNLFLRRGLRFGVVGGGSTLLHALTAVLAVETFSVAPVPANVIAFVAATLFSYVAQTRWAFEHRFASGVLIRFLTVVGLGLLLTVAISGGAQMLSLPYWAGILGVVTVVPAISFSLHHFWTYGRPIVRSVG
jgi:putative flippase GtrA